MVWQPACIIDRELLLTVDSTCLIRIWAVDNQRIKPNNSRPSFSSFPSYLKNSFSNTSDGTISSFAQNLFSFDVSLLLEISDFARKSPIYVAWVEHALAQMSTINIRSKLHTSLGLTSSPAVTGKALMSPSNENNPQSFSGYWLSVLDHNSVVRFVCVNYTQSSSYSLDYSLRGRITLCFSVLAFLTFSLA